MPDDWPAMRVGTRKQGLPAVTQMTVALR